MTFKIFLKQASSTCLLLFLLMVMCAPSVAEPKQYPQLKAIGDFSKLEKVPNDQLICFTLYTLHEKTLKLSAQLYPLDDDMPHEVSLEIKDGQDWKVIAKTKVHRVGWTATFRVKNWNDSVNTPFRVTHPLGAVYKGLIRKDPLDKSKLVVAAFTGNSPGPGGGKISKQDVVDNIQKLNPDVLFFTGDQVYDHYEHTQH